MGTLKIVELSCLCVWTHVWCFEISCFENFGLTVWKSCNCWWLLFKHVLNHLLNHWVYLFFDGLWIVGVGCEVWNELWSFGVFVKNDYDFKNLMIWCYKLIFWFILMLYWSMLTVGEVCVVWTNCV